MGWWEQDKEGRSFAEGEAVIGLWGDGPADLIADAVDAIVKEFEGTWNRPPTRAEIRSGLEFHVRILDIPEEGYEPVELTLGQPPQVFDDQAP